MRAALQATGWDGLMTADWPAERLPAVRTGLAFPARSRNPPTPAAPQSAPASASSVDRPRATRMPIRCQLKAMGNIEQLVLRKVVADQLQADRQAPGKTTGNRHAGQAGQVHCNGVDVRQVHLDWISRLFAQLECGRRG